METAKNKHNSKTLLSLKQSPSLSLTFQ